MVPESPLEEIFADPPSFTITADADPTIYIEHVYQNTFEDTATFSLQMRVEGIENPLLLDAAEVTAEATWDGGSQTFVLEHGGDPIDLASPLPDDTRVEIEVGEAPTFNNYDFEYVATARPGWEGELYPAEPPIEFWLADYDVIPMEIVLVYSAAVNFVNTEPPVINNNVITIPEVTGVIYTDDEDDSVLSGTIELSEGESIYINAEAVEGYSLLPGPVQWSFEYESTDPDPEPTDPTDPGDENGSDEPTDGTDEPTTPPTGADGAQLSLALMALLLAGGAALVMTARRRGALK